MAKAEFVPPSGRPNVVLTLTDEEAANLKAVLCYTHWENEAGDSIYNALEELDLSLEDRATVEVASSVPLKVIPRF